MGQQQQQQPSAGISIRCGFRWNGAGNQSSPLAEDTCTLVLSSPAAHFVDLRVVNPILRPDAPKGVNTFSDILRHLEQGHAVAESEADCRAALDWAFAGTSSRVVTQPATSTNGAGEQSQAQWAHWVDSRHADAAAVVDRGSCRTYFDDIQQTLIEDEFGDMMHPGFNQEVPYQEVWAVRDANCSLGSQSTVNKEKVCIVLQTDDLQSLMRGIIIRVGAWIQGVLRHGDEVSAVRYLLTEEGWTVKAKIGKGTHLFAFPCATCAFTEHELREIPVKDAAEVAPGGRCFQCNCGNRATPHNTLQQYHSQASASGKWLLREKSTWS